MRNRYVLFADIVSVALAAWGAFAFRFGWVFLPDRPEFPLFLVTAIVIKVAVFYGFGLYQRYWSYATVWDLLAVLLANFAASLLFGTAIVGARLAGLIEGLSRSVMPIDLLLAMALTAGVRLSMRVLAETKSRRPTSRQSPARRALIVGAGAAGTMVVRELDKNPNLGLKPVGFLDDDRSKQGKKIYGLTVLGPTSAFDSVVQSKRVDEVIVAMPTVSGAVVRSIVDTCIRLGIPSRVMPGIYELLDGQVSVSRLRGVDITDLLRRPEVAIRPDSADYLRGSRVVITGAGGSIGSELVRQVAHAQPGELVLLGHGENSIFDIMAEVRSRFPQVPVRSVIADIRDFDRISRLFHAARPDVVFHAAAHKHVSLMEDNPEEAISNNVVGTRNVVEAAAAAGAARLVLVSTDKAVAPGGFMGASKRIAEMIVRDAARRYQRAYVVVRFGNVLGSRGSVVPIFKSQIARGGPVTVTHREVRRFFMTIPEAVHLVLQAGGLGRGEELFVLDMGEPVALLDLARDIIRLSGFAEDEIPIVFTGLGEGEKLEEALWETGAQVSPTECPGVRMVAEPEPLRLGEIKDAVDRLIEAGVRHDHPRILRELRECIPSVCWDPSREIPSPKTLRSVSKLDIVR